jgi:predicted esterase
MERLKERARLNGRILQQEAEALLERSAETLTMREARRLAERWRHRLDGRSMSDSAQLIREDRDSLSIFRNASALGVGTRDYSLWGSSAGARMAASMGSHGVAAHGGDMLPKPSAVVIAYTAHSDHSSGEPPTFVVVGDRDVIAPPSSMERRISALRGAGTEVEYHKYRNLGHGFGSGTGTSAAGWIVDAVRFWEKFIAQRK